ncbi:L-gulonolactone oxidase 2 [Prunus yedoensis var. nudiflora]|uniref:L-gulonolactone oxidase 2 n=1 Tax=Prunus yedoensis var. nudiflora TaxID=2094558 RepID=A0A314ZSU4_PRUYE|nr:L-gulonolactone oxidase 2 [Prunus yedoensis var. nudiflora]
MFKRSITYLRKNDSDLGDQVVGFGKQHEFADVLWYPSQHKAVYRMDDRVSLNTPGNGFFDFIPFRATSSLELAITRTTEENQESTRDADGKCSSVQKPPSSIRGCLDSLEDARITACAWDPRIKGEFFHQTTFSISLSVAKNFIQDVKKLVEIEPKALCGVDIYNGILLRYVTASSAYLGKQENAIDFDITYYRSKDPMAPRLYQGYLKK